MNAGASKLCSATSMQFWTHLCKQSLSSENTLHKSNEAIYRDWVFELVASLCV